MVEIGLIGRKEGERIPVSLITVRTMAWMGIAWMVHGIEWMVYEKT